MNRNIIVGLVAGVAAVGVGYMLLSGKQPSPQITQETPDPAASKEVNLTEEQAVAAGITTAKAMPATIRDTLPLYGSIVVNAERSRDIAARYPGTVRSVTVKVGDSAKEGATLATVESNESLQTYSVKAPINGVVTIRNANQGEQTGDKILFTVADLSTVWVELSLFPRDATKVHVGQRVIVKTTEGGITGEGAIAYLAPLGNNANQSRTARIILNNAGGVWAPGLYVTAEVILAETPVPVAVDSQAIQTMDGKDTAFVRTSGGFEPRTLTIGRRDREHVEILAGLNNGEAYASDNSFVLKSALGAEAEND